jgi:sugar lactone lactonase YvrE
MPARAGIPRVFVGEAEARVLGVSSSHVRFAVPLSAEPGVQPVRFERDGEMIGELVVARSIATGMHMVDSPAFDGLGRLYVTRSGSRGVKVPVSLYRIGADGQSDGVAVDLPNPTSLALGPDGAMFVSSRFEGQVYRLSAEEQATVYAGELGVPTGLAFASDGSLFVGDRSGSIFRVSPGREVSLFASIPASVAAFHLTFAPDDVLYVAAPTLSAHDAIYRVGPDRLVDTVYDGFGRPQGLAFDSAGMLYVADALAGASGIFRLDPAAPSPEQVVAAPVVVGLAFDPDGGLIVVTSETVWRLDVPLRPPGASRRVA